MSAPQTKWAGERWENRHDRADIYNLSGDIIASNPRYGSVEYIGIGVNRLHRAVACFNALSGVANPVAIPAVIEALESVDTHYSGSLDHQPGYVSLVRAALKQLRGEA